MSSSSDEFESASEGESSFDSPARSPKNPAEIAKTVPEVAPQNQWSGWGSWVNSAYSAVQESFSEDMSSIYTTARDLGDGLRKATEEGIDKVYDTLDTGSPTSFAPPAELPLPEQPDGSNDQESAQKALSPESRRRAIVTGNLLQSTEVVLGGIDKALDFTSDLLGNAMLGGYRKFESAKLGEKLNEVRRNVEKSRVGHTLFDHGVTALEAIGSVIGQQAARRLAEGVSLPCLILTFSGNPTNSSIPVAPNRLFPAMRL